MTDSGRGPGSPPNDEADEQPSGTDPGEPTGDSQDDQEDQNTRSEAAEESEAHPEASETEPGAAGTEDTQSDAAPAENTQSDAARAGRVRSEASEARDTRSKTAETTDDVPSPMEHPLRWYLNSTSTLVVVSRDILLALAVVAVLGAVLFGVSGVWPPLVAVESGSMEPNINQGDLVLIVDNERFVHDAATEHGIVTRETGSQASHESFGDPGSVIVYRPNGGDGTPIIHRTEFYVEEGEDWVDRADPAFIGADTTCDDLSQSVCPAPHDGYVTRGDDNRGYDQVQGQSTVVAPEWIQGKAAIRIPYLGCIRLELEPGAPRCR